MRVDSWLVAAVGLGALVALVAFSVATASSRSEEIYTQLNELNAHHRDVETRLRRLRSDVNLSGIFVRDYLLDSERERADEYRQQLTAFRQANVETLTALHALVGATGTAAASLDRLRERLDAYWEAFDPLIDWTPAEKLGRSAAFLRRVVLPRREAVLAITQEIEALNNANLDTQRAEVTRRYTALRDSLRALFWQSLLFGLVVAATVTLRLRVLEGRSEQQRLAAREAEAELRRLSRQLVALQEEERRHLSRELHDHVGQMLTALRLELGRLERSHPEDPFVTAAVAESRRVVDEMVSTVRDLALGLRPSMLDDFGLAAALEWLVRDVSRRSRLQVDLELSGDLTALDDRHRTCVYRVVQEALTNVIRHACAEKVLVGVACDPQGVGLSVTDDGVGLPPDRRGRGMGLRGIEERVRELGGSLTLARATARGTALRARLPFQMEEMLNASTGR